MADVEYFSGLPEVGIVPRAPHVSDFAVGLPKPAP